MLMNLEVIDWFNVSDMAGYLLILTIFPFSVKAAIVYFKVERKDSGEKLKSTKYYQLLILAWNLNLHLPSIHKPVL